MPDSATYNGWKNRTTWAVALWFANDEPTYWLARDVATSPGMDSDGFAAWTRAVWADLPTDMRLDIGADLSSVDWSAVLESLRD